MWDQHFKSEIAQLELSDLGRGVYAKRKTFSRLTKVFHQALLPAKIL